MDLLIKKGNQSVKLSDYGIYNIAITESSPSLELDTRKVRGRSGKILADAVFLDKTIKVTGRMTCSTIEEIEQRKDDLNALLMDDEAFFITKMVPTRDEIYSFELPGQRVGDLELAGIPHKQWRYGYEVLSEDGLSYNFLGRSNAGLKFDLTVAFVTTGLPFGRTNPKDVTVVNKAFGYEGTAKLSQLDWPFEVELVSAGGQASFYLEIDGRRFTFEQASNLVLGDKLRLKGIETTLNGTNVTAKTNYEYFVIKPSVTKITQVTTNFNGTIKLLNFVELYK
ncbi:TPA: phage tail family protein [Streptococcus suis]|nr:phage tail family protein [Streptococcus suis]